MLNREPACLDVEDVPATQVSKILTTDYRDGELLAILKDHFGSKGTLELKSRSLHLSEYEWGQECIVKVVH